MIVYLCIHIYTTKREERSQLTFIRENFTQVILQAENEEELIGLLHVGLGFWVCGVFYSLLLQAESLVPAKQNRTGISGAGGIFCRILCFFFPSSSSLEDDDDGDDEVRSAVLWPVPKNLG